jgi:hypothetical protein
MYRMGAFSMGLRTFPLRQDDDRLILLFERILSVHSRLRRPPSTSLTFRLRLPKLIVELEASLRDVMEGWTELDRERVFEISTALADACKIEGLREPAVVARSLACLMQLSREQILPIEAAFREKIVEILGSLKGTAHRVLTGSG